MQIVCIKVDLMGKIPDEDTSCRLKRRTVSHLEILKKKLHYHSIDELISILVDITMKKDWSKTDLESIARYGKIIQVMEGSAKSEDEMYEALGVKKFEEKGFPVKGKIKKKKDSK
jgi:ribosome biogenesis protein Tsr3